MTQFTDNQNRKWDLKLTGPLADEIEEKHKIDLTNLEEDPLIKIRNNPRKLVAIIYLMCRRQIESLGIDPAEFAECLPTPPDEMLEALTEAVIGFFPSGRASHVREVLTEYAKGASTADEIIRNKLKAINEDPKIKERMMRKGDQEFDRLLNEILPTPEPG